MMKSTPTTLDAYRLLHDGAIALAEVERTGIRIDVKYLDHAIERTGMQIAELEKELKADKLFATWRKHCGQKTSLGSREQLARILFDVLEHPCESKTATGKHKADAETLLATKLPFVKQYIRWQNLQKAQGTYLHGIREETVDGFIHPGFNLNTVKSYRSSSSAPNFQNYPVRDKEIAELIRKCFIPRKGCVFVETDYGTLEFMIASCVWADPAMVEYASDSKLDIHRDVASWCYKCDVKQVSEDTRYCGKNMFTFPKLYGSWWKAMASSLWDAVGSLKLKLEDGTSLRKHLRRNGISRLGGGDSYDPRPGSFEHHIQGVEKSFEKKFPTFTSESQRRWDEYQKRGWFDMVTGFRVVGHLKRNAFQNYGIQGPAFHCLLKSLILMVRKLRKLKMRSRIVGEIHDSIIGDVRENEVDDYCSELKRIMTVTLPKLWPWIIVPLKVEMEIGTTSWFDKEQVEI